MRMLKQTFCLQAFAYFSFVSAGKAMRYRNMLRMHQKNIFYYHQLRYQNDIRE
ncbi:hypothetical protein PVAP13_9KG378379 [Panicum virgatum]|uniref:Uncharacterized protein n=1 Tax=Panicum virgatum TaxID=38727 RepID=A0A8T0N8Y1_PANVG|nr:hypothetical protein PVAP13_9KG378379 [Panicum virgatum]